MNQIVANSFVEVLFLMGLIIYVFSKNLSEAFSIGFTFKKNNKNERDNFMKGLGVSLIIVSIVILVFNFVN